MIRSGLFMAAILVAGLSLGVASFGADADMKALMERISALEAKNEELERRANMAKSTSEELDRAIAKEEATAASVTSSRSIKIGGYIDTGFTYNFNRPDNQNNNLRTFDTDSNGFNLHLAELTFDALPSKPGEVGFRIDTAWGTDVRWFKAQDKFADPANRNSGIIDTDLKQAYISYIIPLPGCASCGTKKGVTVDMGKFVTWAGFETIEAADNFNTSRSILFGYAIPFTHTGVRATYDVFKNDCHTWTVGAGIYNGWDNIQDQNNSKTFALYSDLKLTKWFEMVNVGIVGNERFSDERAVFANNTGLDVVNGAQLDPLDPTTPGFGSRHTGDTVLGVLDNGRAARFFDNQDGGGSRYLIDTSLIFKPLCGKDDLIVALNGDFGRDPGMRGENFIQVLGAGLVPDHPLGGNWYGGAAYVKWQFKKNWYLAVRGEYFNDSDGVRTGIRQQMVEGTVTLNWNLSDNLASRLEFRSDRSNRRVFGDTNGVGDAGPDLNRPGGANRQNTISYSWLYKW